MSDPISWLVQGLRLTTFLPHPLTLEVPSLWSEVVGEGPDNEQHNRRTGEFLQIGTLEGWALRLRVLPGRVDWNLNVANEESAEAPAWGGSMAASFELMTNLGNSWLQLTHHAHRIAFGAILVRPVEDRVAGYRLISSRLHGVAIEGDNISDFLYQINRPRASTVNDGRINNRLSKWSVAHQSSGIVAINLQPGQSQTSTTVNFDEGTYAGRLELDISTAPTPNQDELQQVRQVFAELMQLAKEISEEGDLA